MMDKSLSTHINEVIQRAEHEFFKHVDKDTRDMILECEINGTKISFDVYKELKINSYEWKVVLPFLCDAAFTGYLENAIHNRSRKIGARELPRHYDDFILTDGVDELLKRFKRQTLDTNLKGC
jgi:hypothetical protein